MNWLKIAAVAVGALIAFLLVGEVVHIIMGLISFVLIAALVVGGGYVAYKVVTADRRRGRNVRDRHRDREINNDRDDYRASRDRRDDFRQPDYSPPPPPSRPNVDDELNRLRREMGS
jgi:hypothetical protein